MDISKMLKPEELPFPVSEQLASDINALREAYACDSEDLDAYLDEVEGSARDCRTDEEDMWIRRYYVLGDWMKSNE